MLNRIASSAPIALDFPKAVRANHIADPQDHLRAHLSFDLNSGRILSEHKSKEPVHPASLTKLITVAVILDLIEAGKLKPDDVIKISKRASKMHSPNSKLEQLTIQQAIEFIFPKSFNDIGVAIAEHIGRTEWRFCHEYMNPKAKELGLTDTEFWSATGLLDRDRRLTKHLPENVTTAWDLMKLTIYLMQKYPEILTYSSQKTIVVNDKHYSSTNPLVFDESLNVDGLKTGTLERAGSHLIATSSQNGHRVVAISLGNYYPEQRKQHALSLLTEGRKILQDPQNIFDMK